MKLYFLVALFGAAGTLLRYSIYKITPNFFISNFPVATLAVNLVGSFLIGFFIALYEKNLIDNSLRYVLTYGFLGGFTTFSTFSMDMFNLINKSLYFYASFYILSSVILGLVFFVIGKKTATFF